MGDKGGRTAALYDGTLLSLIHIYQTDPDSTFRNVRFATARKYNTNLRLLAAIQHLKLSEIRGRDFPNFFRGWSSPEEEGAARRLTRANSAIEMLRILFAAGIALEIDVEQCQRLSLILSKHRFEQAGARKQFINAEQAIAIRRKAHELGFHSIALAQAIQFETLLRQKDVIGEWVPMSEPGMSSVTRGADKWLYGIDWREVEDMRLTHRLSKSLHGRDAVIDPDRGTTKVFDLRLYPMIMEEIANIPDEQRVGPMIKDDRTGLPWGSTRYTKYWREIARAAGVPDAVQNRDSRAGGITEGIRAMEGDLEALKHAAGHSQITTTQRYSRASDEQTAKVAKFRAAKRLQE